MGAFARHGAKAHVDTFHGRRCMVDLWERWTETSSTRDLLGRNGVTDDFGSSIVICRQIGWRPVRVAFLNV
jgi:hypothetical protein